jgi:hypothetical protein
MIIVAVDARNESNISTFLYFGSILIPISIGTVPSLLCRLCQKIF